MTFPAGAISAGDIRSQLYTVPATADGATVANQAISWSQLYGEGTYLKDYGTGCNASVPTSGAISLSQLKEKEAVHTKAATGSNSTLDSTGIHPSGVRSNHITRTVITGTYNAGAATSTAVNHAHVLGMDVPNGQLDGTDCTGSGGGTGGTAFTANNPTVISNNLVNLNDIRGGGGQGGNAGGAGHSGYGNPGNNGGAGGAGGAGNVSMHSGFICIQYNFLREGGWQKACYPERFCPGSGGNTGSGANSGGYGNYGGGGSGGNPGGPGSSGNSGNSGNPGNPGWTGNAGNQPNPGNPGQTQKSSGTGCHGSGQWNYRIGLNDHGNFFCGRRWAQLGNQNNCGQDTGFNYRFNYNNAGGGGGCSAANPGNCSRNAGGGGGGGGGGSAGAKYSGSVSLNTYPNAG